MSKENTDEKELEELADDMLQDFDPELDAICIGLESVAEDTSYKLPELISYELLISHCKDDIHSLVDLFEDDPKFIETFGNVPSEWESKVSAQVSMEKLASLNFFKWGFKGLFAGWILDRNFLLDKRLASNLEALQTTNKDYTKRISQYLPEYNSTMDILNGLVMFGKTIENLAKDPNGADLKEVHRALEAIGIRTGPHPELSQSWTAEFGKFAARFYVMAVTRRLSAGNAETQKEMGIRSKLEPIKTRGWDSNEKLEQATVLAISLTSKAKKLAKDLSTLADVNITKMPPEKKEELRKINKIIHHCLGAYKDVYVFVIRGIAGAVPSKLEKVLGPLGQQKVG
jgi:hypothetical protein